MTEIQFHKTLYEWTNERTNEWCISIHLDDATAATGQDNGTSALTTHQLQVERRESHRANQVDGDY